MKKLRQELLENARHFETYEEMYCFIRQNTRTLEDFNIDMQDARKIFKEKK